jgi:hypothetical protein
LAGWFPWVSLGVDKRVMDIFYAGDTVLHSWEVLASILSSDKTPGILCDIGMYVLLYSFFFLFFHLAITLRANTTHIYVCCVCVYSYTYMRDA